MRGIIAAVCVGVAFTPSLALAFPFGGQIGIIRPCYTNAIYVALGPPRGGPYIWTPSTRTYQFGAPNHVGQWLLGLASAPYYCVVSIFPVIVWPGTHIDMMGSSGPAASISLGGALSQGTPPPSGGGSSGGNSGGSGGGTSGGTPTGVGRMLVSEVFVDVDAVHGSDPANEWIEIYNGTAAQINLSGWRIVTSAATTTLPTLFLSSGQRHVISASADTRTLWSIATGSFTVVSGLTGSGLNPTGGSVRLVDPAGGTVDALSWGTNTTAFSPAAPALTSGRSLERTSILTDSNTATDWVLRTAPTPGN